MIPVWLLTTLHYISMGSGVAILVLLVWQPLSSSFALMRRVR